jgi:hypothetical protein
MNTIPTRFPVGDAVRSDERGAVLVVLVAVLLPVLLIVATMTQAMTQRTRESATAVELQKALLAADAGIDEATYRGGLGLLVDGESFEIDIDGDGDPATGPMHCTVTPTWLRGDHKDNDGDVPFPLVDEADEDVFQVIAVGTYKGAQRRLAAYLGPVPLLPTIQAAAVLSNPNVAVQFNGSSQFSGVDVGLNGVPTGTLQAGMNITAPGTLAWLDGQLTGGERTRVVGSGLPPSIGTTGAIDWTSLVPTLTNIADVVLTSGNYSGLMVGSTSPWTPRIAYRSGNVRIQGTSTGVGILLVNGNLELRGNFTWYGVVIVTGTMDCSMGSALIRGSVLQTSTGASVTSTGNLTVQYSAAAIAMASAQSGRYTSFNGWQELSRQ